MRIARPHFVGRPYDFDGPFFQTTPGELLSELRRFKKFMTSNQPLLVFNVLLKKKKDQQRLLKLVWMKELEDRIWNFVEIQHSYSKSQLSKGAPEYFFNARMLVQRTEHSNFRTF